MSTEHVVDEITDQGPARALIHSGDPAGLSEQKRGVMYLRVSTPSQVKTDYDPEGISIPAQRESCRRKAEQMGVDVVEEYVEPGRSGTRMDQRPAFQEMLDRIRSRRDVDYVIVYKLSRMNRNRVDDALVLTALRKYKVTLVSATENIDESPVGQLVHGILASINEFRSAEDGADIRYKMGEKARRGGTLGRAKLGYVNVRESFEGHEVRTIGIDPERAPLVKVAFELFATGEYTFERLQAELADRGLKSRPGGRYPAGEVSDSKLQAMLRDPYYTGVVTYKGETFTGRHEPIISQELFDRVQEVLETRVSAGERLRKHPHYLKGTVWCGRCHDEGNESRLLVQRSIGRLGGEYFYFFCSRRPKGQCSSHYVQIEEVEDAIQRHYATVRFTRAFSDAVRIGLRETLDDRFAAGKLMDQRIATDLAALDRQEENLIDLAADATLPQEKVRERLRRIQQERNRLRAQREVSDDRLEIGAAVIQAALDILDKPSELYRSSGPKHRRLINQAVFEKVYVYENGVTDHVLREPFAELIDAQQQVGRPTGLGTRPRSRGTAGTKEGLLDAVYFGVGSSKTSMVEPDGIEPTTSCMPSWSSDSTVILTKIRSCAHTLRADPFSSTPLACPAPHVPLFVENLITTARIVRSGTVRARSLEVGLAEHLVLHSLPTRAGTFARSSWLVLPSVSGLGACAHCLKHCGDGRPHANEARPPREGPTTLFLGLAEMDTRLGSPASRSRTK
jgi:site-specific DNA recombinase